MFKKFTKFRLNFGSLLRQTDLEQYSWISAGFSCGFLGISEMAGIITPARNIPHITTSRKKTKAGKGSRSRKVSKKFF